MKRRWLLPSSGTVSGLWKNCCNRLASSTSPSKACIRATHGQSSAQSCWDCVESNSVRPIDWSVKNVDSTAIADRARGHLVSSLSTRSHGQHPHRRSHDPDRTDLIRRLRVAPMAGAVCSCLLLLRGQPAARQTDTSSLLVLPARPANDEQNRTGDARENCRAYLSA